jgi:YesN/AraC family two-component response regulator
MDLKPKKTGIKMRRILIVDDESIPRKMLKSIVSWNELGYEVAGEAANGKTALALAEELRPDVIFADITMPVMNGIELIRRLKEKGNPAKIVILSCHEDFNYVREALRLGAVDYLLKHTLKPADILGIAARLDIVYKNEFSKDEAGERLEQEAWDCFISEGKEIDPGRYSQKVRKAVEYIRTNRHKPATLDSIATYAGISRIYLSQIFKKETGINISDFILKYRIAVARQFLKSGSYRIYEIAEKTGFASPRYFSHVFRIITGMSPQKYKNYSDNGHV